MSWVLLALRKRELKKTKAEYTAQDLRISREERQAARRYQHENSVAQNSQRKALSDLRQTYNEQKSGLYDQIAEIRKQAEETGQNSSEVMYDGKTIQDIYNEINDLKTQYDEDVNNEKTFWEDELAQIEEEANDEETMYEQEKVTIETQMEAVAQELEAINQALSQEIQQCTIKLS